MPNWCLNEITVTSHPEDKEKLKALMFNPETGELDFSLASPRPKALDGMLLRAGDNVAFNKLLDTRASLHHTSDFIALLREKNAKRDVKLDYLAVKFIRENIGDITDEPILKDEDRQSYSVCGDDVFEAELLFIGALEKELMSAPCYTPTTPVEVILEHLLNTNKSEIKSSDEDDFLFNFRYVRSAVNSCSKPVRHAIQTLTNLYLEECEEVYGSADAYHWNIDNWGTKWNACEANPSEDFTYVSFDTAWSPPAGWLYELAAKVKEQCIRGFSASLRYAEGGMWFGGELFINSPYGYDDYSFDDDEIREFLGMEFLDDDFEEEVE